MYSTQRVRQDGCGVLEWAGPVEKVRCLTGTVNVLDFIHLSTVSVQLGKKQGRNLGQTQLYESSKFPLETQIISLIKDVKRVNSF